MANFIYFFLFTLSFLPFYTRADIDVKRCEAGETDVATGLTCGDKSTKSYGYDATWIVTNATNGAAKYITVNGVWPPPNITVNIFQRIRIKLVNKMADNEPVTLHFHGILQENGYTTMDGPQGLTQSPVMPGHNFTYDFPANKAGTFWIHSHATGQYPKGLRSPLIVTDDADKQALGYPNGPDYTVSVSDWWPDFWAVEKAYNENNCGNGLEVPPSKIIVNDNAPEWKNGLNNGNLSYFVAPGQTARFRFINLSAFARFYIHLSTNQTMKVIEIDGVTVEPADTTGIELASGQRVSVTIAGVTSDISTRIIFVSDPRIDAGQNKDGCRLIPSSFGTAPNVINSQTQLAWAFIDHVSTNPIRNIPILSDLNKGNDTLIWSPDSQFGRPFYAYRPKVPFKNEVRVEDIGNNQKQTLWIPKYAYDFNEVDFVPKDQEGPWMVADGHINESYIHTILLNGNRNTGRGAMGLSTATQSDPQSEFPKTEQAGTGPLRTTISTTTTLMRALRNTNSQMYLDPLTYSDFPHTIILPNQNMVHWFVLRSKQGDHPIHMHGHEFQILAKLAIPTNPSTNNPYSFNYTGNLYQSYYDAVKVKRIIAGQPTQAGVPRRDTLMIEKGWDYVIAIKSNNPGVWAMHCHNDFHAETGMFMQLVEAPAALRQIIGTWSQGAIDPNICSVPGGTSIGPTLSWNGTNTMNFTKQYPTSGKVWPPFEQTIRESMQYYGAPESCYNYNAEASIV